MTQQVSRQQRASNKPAAAESRSGQHALISQQVRAFCQVGLHSIPGPQAVCACSSTNQSVSYQGQKTLIP